MIIAVSSPTLSLLSAGAEGLIEPDQLQGTYQSPLSPLPEILLLAFSALPAAAEAKLEVNGEGMMRLRRVDVVGDC